MPSKIVSWRRMMPLLACLSFPVLTNCASAIRPLPQSSSEILVDTTTEAVAKVCEGLKPQTLTEAEEADVLALNYSARAGTKWRKICGPKKEASNG